MAQKYFKANVEKLESLRIARGWSREALANKAVLSTRTLDSLMAGENGVLSTFAKLAKALDTPVNSLLNGYDPPTTLQPRQESPPDHSEAISKQRIHIKLTFGGNAPFNLESRKTFIENIVAQAIEAEGQIVVIEIIKGSIIVELEMSEADLLRLIAAFSETRLDSIDVVAIHLPATTGPLAAGLRQIVYPPGTLAPETTDPATPEMTLIRTPTKAQTFSVEQPTENNKKLLDRKTVNSLLRLLEVFVLTGAGYAVSRFKIMQAHMVVSTIGIILGLVFMIFISTIIRRKSTGSGGETSEGSAVSSVHRGNESSD